jgi:signal transduction histidine kinase/CheY-like chemotaxis protein/HPt (histidine-containing phosphotransfer) domain-containing protein
MLIEIIKLQKLTVPLKSFLFWGLAVLLITTGFTVNATPQIQPQAQSVLMDVTLQSAVILVCFGILVAVLMYSTFVAIGSREKSHGYYALTAAVLIWAFAQLFDFYAYPEALLWVPVMLLPVVNGLFITHFLRLQKYQTMMHKLVLGNAATAILFTVLATMMPYFGLAGAILVNFGWLVLALISGVLTSLRGIRSAIYFCGALGCLFSSVLLVLFVQINELTAFGPGEPLILLLGGVFYVILVSFAMVDKFTNIAKRNMLSSESLEQMVAQRTDELQKANLGLEKLAIDSQAASEAKNTFLVNMSHEIRTPLTAIIGYADGMLRGEIRAEAKDNAISIISQNGSHLLHIINELLDISKIESNTLEIEMLSFDPLSTIQGVEKLVSEQVHAKGLVLGINYQLPLPTLMVCDQTRFRQVLLNLVNNAIKFTHMGAIEITISADLDKLYLAVSDTGIGMSQSQIDGMFTAFHQEDLSKSRQYGGIGLGLSIAKSLINKMGGNIDVTSIQGQGSTFTVDFSLTVPQEAKWLHDKYALDQRLSDIERQAKIIEQVDVPTLTGNVLLAEDHLDNQALFVSILERVGLNVTAVDNGYKAVQATLEEEFELILLDIQMPEMDGLKAFELIQSTCSNVPVIALTANAMKADVELYMSLGFNAHIAKPINRENFIETITRYLNIEKPQDVSLEGDEMDDIKAQYVVRLVKRVSDLRDCQAQNDWEEIGKHAHAIKGSAGMFGFDDLGTTGGQLELAVKNGVQEECESQLHQLLQMCDVITAG